MLKPTARAVTALAAAFAFAACSSQGIGTDPTAQDDQALASEFDQLSRDANVQGDSDGGAAFSSAAIAVRLGIRPSPLKVKIGERTDDYLGFVHAVTRQAEGTTVAMRTLVAWHVQLEKRPDAVLYLATAATDNGVLGHPAATDQRFDIRTLAVASWKQIREEKIWVATAGKAGIAEKSKGDSCSPTANANVQCIRATFSVALDGEFHPLVSNDRRRVDRETKLNIATRADPVNGVIFSFATP